MRTLHTCVQAGTAVLAPATEPATDAPPQESDESQQMIHDAADFIAQPQPEPVQQAHLDATEDAEVIISGSAGDATASSQQQLCEVHMRVKHEVGFGCVVYAVGEPQELGAWDAPRGAAALSWSEGHVWVAKLSLPPGTHHFKVSGRVMWVTECVICVRLMCGLPACVMC